MNAPKSDSTQWAIKAWRELNDQINDGMTSERAVAILIKHAALDRVEVSASNPQRNKSRFNVYDEVWVMVSDRPQKRLVFAVVESMDFPKNGTELRYHLVSSQIGAGWGNNSGETYGEHEIFPTKSDLLASL